MMRVIFLSLIGLLFQRGTGQTTTTSPTTTTAAPTCEESGQITHFDWDDLMSNISVRPEMSYTMNVDTSTLAFELSVDLEYLGDAFADDHTPGFGTTYILDFEDYNAESDDIREPGNCQNRVTGDFGGAWNTLWQYSDTPHITNHLAHSSVLSYPPAGDYWDLSIDNVTDICTPIHYEGSWTWSELRGCGSYDGLTEYTVVTSDDTWLNLSGVFYINIVSPLAHLSDTGYYRVYQMLSAPFVIALRNQINIISSVGINLFTITIIAVYKEDLETDWRLIVLTESADFLMLSDPTLLSSPTLNPNTITFDMRNESLHSGCLTASTNICSQLWEVYADDVTCPPTNFTGTYGFEFTTTCNPDANYTNNTELCNDYINQYGSQVALSAPLAWLDEVCNPEIFIVQFEGIMTFYNDSNYDHELGANDQYALGDTAYVQITVNTPPDSTFDLIALDLYNVWVCTTSPDNEPLTIDDQNLGTSGCLSGGSIIDSGFPWHLVVNGEENDLTDGGDVVFYSPWVNGTIQFSFIIDSSISRVNLWIQAQINLDLVSSTTTTTSSPLRRRMLLQVDSPPSTSQMRHFSGATGINPEAAANDDVINEIEANPTEGVNDGVPVEFVYIAVGGIATICVVSLGCFGLWFYRNKNKAKETQKNMIQDIVIAAQQKRKDTIPSVSNRRGTVDIITTTPVSDGNGVKDSPVSGGDIELSVHSAPADNRKESESC